MSYEVRFIGEKPCIFLDDEELPSRVVVCGMCGGKGCHVNPSIDGHGITLEEMDELGPEFFEDYMGGMFDVQCYRCHGKRVDAEVVDERLTKAQREAVERDWEADAAERSEQRLRDLGVQF